jgi:cation transport regulator ChaB
MRACDYDMTTTTAVPAGFPKALRDLFPPAAQVLYMETYARSLADATSTNRSQLSNEGVATRDAWDAVRRVYEEDSVTHKWRLIGEAAQPAASKPSLFHALKKLFGR